MRTPIEEAIVITGEECAEVIQVTAKVQRFGLDEFWPERRCTKRQALEHELGDVMAMIIVLEQSGVIDRERLISALELKLKRLKEHSKLPHEWLQVPLDIANRIRAEEAAEILEFGLRNGIPGALRAFIEARIRGTA